jgi:large subunit ribosomal protein L29
MATKKIDKKTAQKIAEKKSAAGKLRELSPADLQTKINDLKQELFNLRFQAAVGKLENTAQLKKTKKEIARCYTVLTERSNAKAN